jgi:FPC/CPF motif-containing protein YcgG
MSVPKNPADVALLERAWRDPYDGDLARAHSNYYAYNDGDLVRLLETSAPSTFAGVAHDAFRSFVLDNRFPCLGARAALQRGSYRFGAYQRLNDESVTHGLMRDLYAFVAERAGLGETFTTFIAVFRDRVPGGELGFESALWSQLQKLHTLDRQLHSWDPNVSSDPADPHFSFSLAGHAFFVVGMHPKATRAGRRFAWPALIFNAHAQFENLKNTGKYAGLQRQIRTRDIALQGSINANLTDYGAHSEARQYAGREVPSTWKCPFKPT